MFSWGVCPCALSRAIQGAFAGTTVSGAAAKPLPSCCAKHRPASGSCCTEHARPESGSRRDAPARDAPVRDECPKCIDSGCHGSLATTETPVVLADATWAVAFAVPPVLAAFLEMAPARVELRPDGSGAPPPDVGVDTIVLRL